MTVLFSPTDLQQRSAGSLHIVLNTPVADQGGATVALSDLIAFERHSLVVDRSVLLRLLSNRLHDTAPVCEIFFEKGAIILANNVTGARRMIAKPHFNSINDNAFQYLFKNPGRNILIEELYTVTGTRTALDLHKMVENLKFTGVLKQVFFRVSQNAIRFDPRVSASTLAALEIDPVELS